MTPLRQTVGDSNFEEKKFKTQLAGMPAMEVDANLNQFDGAVSYAHTVFVSDKNDEYQVTMMCRADQPHADDVWQKLRASIKKRPPR